MKKIDIMLHSGHQRRVFITKLIFTIILGIFAIVMILPFIWMISTSLKPATDVFKYPVEWIPRNFELKHHIEAWTGPYALGPYYINSIITTIVPLIIAAITGSLAAYGFSKMQFKGRDVLFFFYISMMMVPPQILFVPKFLMFDALGIYNTRWALILPHCVSITGVFLMKQFFTGLPNELSEAAIVDGANNLTIWSRIVLPLSKPVLASFCILCFTWYWNDYENPLIFVVSRRLYTIPLALSNYILENGVDYNGMMAVATAGILPLILIFIFFQKYIVEGVAHTGVKG